MIKAIDTSHWQNSAVNYASAFKSGYKIAILKLGEKKSFDKCFKKDYESAKKAGMKVGVYYFANATTIADAVNEAFNVINLLGDYRIDLPIAYDMEISGYKSKNRKSLNSQIYNKFAETIRKNTKHDVMLYTGESMFNNYFDKAAITDKLWIAKYSSKSPSVGRQIYGWQYTSSAISTDFYKKPLDRSNFYDELSNLGNNIVSTVKVNPYPEPTKTLKLTSPITKGNDVRWLQWELVEAGYNISIDGSFGSATNSALKDFQKLYKLTVDGKCGPATRAALKNNH